MPQFAVYKNPGRYHDIPFVVQIQSTRLDDSRGRVVMPLIRRGRLNVPDHPLTPNLTVQGEAVQANSLDLVTVPAKSLVAVPEILPERDQDRLIRAIDEMVSRA